MKNVILTGFMGTGKTSVGRVLADKIGFDFIDTDKLVIEMTGLSIPDIFIQYGEERFRDEERQIIAGISDRNGIVVSTGGGAVLNELNLVNLRKRGIIVCLTASEEEIRRRLGSGCGRPLLHYDRRGKEDIPIGEIMKKRSKAYEKADIMIDTTKMGITEIAERIRNYMEERPDV